MESWISFALQCPGGIWKICWGFQQAESHFSPSSSPIWLCYWAIPWYYAFVLCRLRVRPGSKNVKPDALSRIFDQLDRPSSPDSCSRLMGHRGGGGCLFCASRLHCPTPSGSWATCFRNYFSTVYVSDTEKTSLSPLWIDSYLCVDCTGTAWG